ncbi:MAG TPA: hypothetical protein VFZ66_27335 [Herpetosiphonaceae bacterium]
MPSSTPTHRLWIQHAIAFDAAQRAAAVQQLRLCHIIPDPSTWNVHGAGGITVEHLAVAGERQDVARAAQILQALQQFVYLSAPPISIGAPADGFPLPAVSSYPFGMVPGWVQAAATGESRMYLIGRSAQDLVVGCYPEADLPIGGLIWHGQAHSPPAAVATWVRSNLGQRPRVVLTEPCAPYLWRVAYQF